MNIINLFTLTIILFALNSKGPFEKEWRGECDVVDFYEAIDPESGVKVLTSSGDLDEPELILVPSKLETGAYEIEVTRKGSNIYKVQGTSYYIETRYCYEYATYEDVILKVESQYGYTKGKIYFD